MKLFKENGDALRNTELFDSSEISKIQEYLKAKILSYINSRVEYEDEWQKWNRALQCIYDAGDHFSKTAAKLFDNETTDAIDTLVKRFDVAIFSSERISKLVWENSYEEEMKNIANKIWDNVVEKLELNKKLPQIIRSGTAFGTFLTKVYYDEKEKYIFTTTTGMDGARKRESFIKKEGKPVIKFMNIYDIILDPTASFIGDSEVVAEKCLVPNDTIEDSDFFMQDKIVEYDDFMFRDTAPGVASGTESKKNQVLYDSGIDVAALITKEMRAIYHVYFDYTDEDGYKIPMYAVLDCASGNILRIEASPYDNYNPYIGTYYIPRNDTFYGIGVAEQTWATQILLNDTLNQYLDNIDMINDMNLLIQDGDSGPAANKPIMTGRYKMIPVMNPQMVVQLKNTGLQNVDVMVQRLRENIQKKSKATLTLQGQALEGNRTATESMGIRDEVNASLKDLIIHIMNDLLQPILETVRKLCVQFMDADDEITLKIPADNSGTRFTESTIRFEDFREMFEKATVKIVGVEEANIKNNKLVALQNLLTMGIQVPNLINIPKIMEKIYFEYMGFEDYDEFMAFTVPKRNKPMDPDRENQILSSGVPINTSEGDDHNAHIQAHTRFYNDFMEKIRNAPQQSMDEDTLALIDDVLMNTDNHVNEHLKEVQRYNENSATVTVA